MSTQNNLHVPEDLLTQAQQRAETQARSADDLAADALQRYLAHELLTELSQGAEERRRKAGVKTEENVERYVDWVIHQHRAERAR